MNFYYPIILLSGALAACSTQSPTPQTDATPAQQQPQITYHDMYDYGVNMGCKAAMQNIGTPESDWDNAPKLSGTHAQYLAGWKAGFEQCRIGLGPAQLPVKQ